MKLGDKTFRNGLVFDSRVTQPYSLLPLVDQGAGLKAEDSGANQHMAVVRDFLIPVEDAR